MFSNVSAAVGLEEMILAKVHVRANESIFTRSELHALLRGVLINCPTDHRYGSTILDKPHIHNLTKSITRFVLPLEDA